MEDDTPQSNGGMAVTAMALMRSVLFGFVDAKVIPPQGGREIYDETLFYIETWIARSSAEQPETESLYRQARVSLLELRDEYDRRYPLDARKPPA